MAEEGGTGPGLAEVVGGADADEAMLAEVLEGLQRADKRIASKYHYDERGSQLFEEITRLDEYYPTRTERALLKEWMPRWVDALRPAALVELGAGNAEKSRIVLDAMVESGCGEAYVPVDMSADFLQETAQRLEEEYPSLAILPTVADITSPLPLPSRLPSPTWIAFLGSTLGNFDDEGAAELLGRIHRRLRSDDRLLLGVDLRAGPGKSAQRIELAYNDDAGVTAAFSLNVLSVLNDALGTDFDLEGFRHRARYLAERGRIETDLVSMRDQVVRFPDGPEIDIAEGEAIRTEISCKYDRPTIDALFAEAGLRVERWQEDGRGYYALVLGAPIG